MSEPVLALIAEPGTLENELGGKDLLVVDLSDEETHTGHHARLCTRLLAKLYRGGHPRPPNFMRFPRRNTSIIGNKLSVEDERRKLKLICETAKGCGPSGSQTRTSSPKWRSSTRL